MSCLKKERQQPARKGHLVYADDITEAIADQLSTGTVCVLKTHFPSAVLCVLAQTYGVPVLVSVRSPHDCVASLMQRFAYSFPDAVFAVRVSMQRLLPIIASESALVLRFEDDFTGNPATISDIAGFLGAIVGEDDQTAIHNSLLPDAVRRHLADLKDTGVFRGENARREIEAGTEWHFDHLGKGIVGGSADYLTAQQIAVVDHTLRDGLAKLGYAPVGEVGPVAVGSAIDMSLSGFGASYLRDGFDVIEDWGVWILNRVAHVVLPLIEPSSDLQIELALRLAPAFTLPSAATCRIVVNGQTGLVLGSTKSGGAYLNLSIPIVDARPGQDAVEIAFISDNVASPAELGAGPDARSLGIGLVSCRIKTTEPPSP